MKFEILTLFPDFFASFFRTSLIKKAVQKGIINYHLIQLRKFGEGSYRQVDDVPYGGKQGDFAGMLIKENVLNRAHDLTGKHHTIYLSPQGSLLTQSKVKELSKKSELVLVCGRYEGIDQRFIDQRVDEEISIGDYILSGGEPAVSVLIDAVTRQLNGVIGNKESLKQESFEAQAFFKQNMALLEPDQYTRPQSERIPRVLLSGDAKKISQWSRTNALIKTFLKRPELIKKSQLSKPEEEILKQYILGE